MPRRVHVDRAGELFDLTETPAPSENYLQEVVKANPQLIPSDDLGLDGDLLVVGRETHLASGAIDLLCLARSGDLVLIEFKTGPQNPDFRHALAQAIDYGSDLWGLTVEDFDRGVVQRYLGGDRVAQNFRGAKSLSDSIQRTTWELGEAERAALIERLTEVLATGDFIYVIAAQRFTDSMRNSLDYLNATMRRGRFYLVEVIQLAGGGLLAHAAQVVAAPPRGGAARSTAGGPRTEADESAFLADLRDPAYGEAIRSIIARSEALGVEVKWGSKGASLRVSIPERSQPLSIGWLFPDDGNGWQGAKYVTLGVDPSSLAKTPSVESAVRDYTERVRAIRGAVRPNGPLLASIISPQVLPSVLTEIDAALTTLVETIGA